MSETNIKDTNYLTTQPIFGALMKLAMPIMASSFFMMLYNITDMFWIGKLGSSAVAGVGTGGMFTWIAQGLPVLARMGGQVKMAQCIGAGEKSRAAVYGRAALKLTAWFAVLFGVIVMCFAPQMISLFAVPDKVTNDYAVMYLRITGTLAGFQFFAFVFNGLFTASGDSRVPFAASVTGLAANMILDPCLVLGIGFFPSMGVAGAAIATVTAQVLSLAVYLVVLFARMKGHDRDILYVQPGTGRQGVYRDILKIGVPSALQTTLYAFFSSVLARLTAPYGAGAIAVSRLGGQIESITWNAADGFSAAMNSFTGQNYGAHKFERIRKGYRISFISMVTWGLAVTGLFLIFPEPLSRLFFFEKDVIDISVSYFRVVGLAEAFMAVELMSSGSIAGFGETRVSSIISIVLTGARIPIALILGKMGLGYYSIWWAFMSTSTLKGIVLWIAFHVVCTRKEKQAL